jgi:hypothetical protein
VQAGLASLLRRNLRSGVTLNGVTFVDKGRLLSLKRRIAAAQTFELTELTEELAKLGSPVPEDLVGAIAERIERGQYVVTGTVASLVAASGSRRLYAAAREHLIKDTWALITLLRADIPATDIEKRLRDELYQVFRNSDDPRRSEILRALDEHGSTDCLDDLKAIQYEFEPRLRTARLARDIGATPERIGPQAGPEALLKAVTHRADIAFGENVRIAAQRIRERGKPPVSGWDTAAAPDDPFALAKSYIEKAERHVAGHDYGASLNYCRKVLEAALKALIKTQGLTVKKDAPVDKLELPPLIAAINSQVDLPKDIRMAIEAVQRDSTYGSHDQGVVPGEVLTAAIAQATIDKYRQIEAHLANVIAGRG